MNSTDGELYRIDASTEDVTTIDLGTRACTRDGILLEGHTLYAVRNQGNVAVIELAPDLSSGTVVDQLTGEPRRPDDGRALRVVALRRQRPLRHDRARHPRSSSG